MPKKNILIFGAGYVGLSAAALMAKKNHITIFDTNKKKVCDINNNICPIEDKELIKVLSDKSIKILATSDLNNFIEKAEYCILCLPTDFNDKDQSFDTSKIENSIQLISRKNKSATIIIKSTVPIGFTDQMQDKFKSNEIIFSPEFLREGKALFDNYYPSRIIVGSESEKGIEFANILRNSSKRKDVNIICMSSSEAESTKLFSNSFLSMKVAFYNELDNFALENNLSTENIINGMSFDSRIGDSYNNPSFGYGGYCLPKDIKQLSSQYKSIPKSLLEAAIKSNFERKKFILKKVIDKNPKKIGVYLLGMKKDSDNHRNSAVSDIIIDLIKLDKDILIYDPNIDKSPYKKCALENNYDVFIKECDLIIANRLDDKIKKIKDKIFTRDVFGIN